MKKSLMGLWFTIALLFFIGCGGEGDKKSAPVVFKDAQVMVADAKTRITEISVEELRAKIDKEEDFILLDVREPDEFEEGHIPGAINIPRGLLEFRIANTEFGGMDAPDKGKELIIYCKMGGRSALATESLLKLGYKNSKNLAGGWEVWEKDIASGESVIDTLKAKPQDTKVATNEKKVLPDKNIESKEEQKQLPKIVLIITSQACECTLERCAKAEKTVNEVVQQFPQKLTSEKLDYAKEQDLVAQLDKEYQLRFLPALLFFDEQGTFKGKLDGSLGKGEIEKKLKELGVE